MSRRVSAGAVWGCFWPLIVYNILQVASTAVLIAAAQLLGLLQGYENNLSLAGILLGAVFSLQLFGWLYGRDERQRRSRLGWEERPIITEGQIFLVVIASAALALFCNNILGLLPLREISESYGETSDVIYGGSIWLQIASAGFAAPVAEEMLMRGLLYGRLKELAGSARIAIVLDAAVFGIFHGNIVQGIYAFAMGLFFAWLVERYRTVMVPAFAHIAANLFILLLNGVAYGSLRFFLMSTILCALVFSVCWRSLICREN